MRAVTRRLLEAVAVAGAVLFVAGMAYLPHADSVGNAPDEDLPALARFAQVYWRLATGEVEPYEYSVHVDENMHWSRMASIERAESLRAEGIYDTVPSEGQTLQLRGLIHERGFFIALVHLHQLTGIEWIDIIHGLPALWAGLTAFLVWCALRPWPGAVVAAALVALIPTSARFLGPGFMVPIGFGLAWIAAGFILLPHTQRVRGAATLLVIVTIWAFFIHLIAGFAVLLLMLVSIPLQGRNFRSFVLLTITSALPLIVLLDVFTEGVQQELERTIFLPLDLTIFDQLGLPFLGLWIVGCAVILTQRLEKPLAIILRASAIASIVSLSFILIALVTRGQQYALYDRWHQPFALFATLCVAAAVVFVVGLVGLAARRLARDGASFERARVPLVLLALLLVASPGTAGHLREPYYHVLDDEDWAGFTWAAANVNDTYDVFLADPWKAPVFHALTGKTPYVFLSPGSPVAREEDWLAYQRGDGRSDVWLAERDITLVFDARDTPAGFERTSEWTVQMPALHAQEIDRIRGDAPLQLPNPTAR